MKKSAQYKKCYACGVFVTRELLLYRPHDVSQVILHTKSKQNQGIEEIKKRCQEHHIPIETNDGLLAKISGKDNTYAMGIFSRYESKVEPSKNHLVLVSPMDTGNIGTIIRTALGFGISDIVIVRPAVDIFDQKAIRSSMGALFSTRIQYMNTFQEYNSQYQRTKYAFMTDGKTPLSRAKFSEPFALIFGNESSGLPQEMKSQFKSVQIEQTGRIDSLNLAIAVGIGLHHAHVFLKREGANIFGVSNEKL